MRTFIAFAISLTLSVTATPQASAQSVQSSYVCPDCGRIHGSPIAHSSTIQQSPPIVQAYPQASVQYSQPVVTSSPVVVQSPVAQTSYTRPVPRSGTSYSSGGTSNVLGMLNSQRARSGVPALTYDPTLQAVAQRRAQQMASMGLKYHPPGSFAPGRYEGVGWSSSYSPSGVAACYTKDPNMRYAGAAMASGSDGVYFVVVYR